MRTPTGPSYGLDAPRTVVGLLIGGALGLLAGLAVLATWTPVRLAGAALALASVVPLGYSVLMVDYARRGKFRVRDRILGSVAWRGDEQVLDIGTGRGLLLIGAAKQLATGTAVGVDIWSREDLSGNRPSAALRNAEVEGVLARVQLRSEDAREMSFGDATFDLVVSNLCLHNIRSTEGRERACGEIVRVLKPGGVALISDYTHVEEYTAAFGRSGCTVTPPVRINFFPPLRLFSARKA